MKKIAAQTLTGQFGVNLVENRVLDMGYLWYPTGSVEAGIDGYIEIRDPVTKAALNSIVLVQSKATANDFESETDEGFVFRCKENDLQYWLMGTAPVILVVSRPRTNEAYWVSVKDYFSNPERRQQRKIYFSKTSDVFDRHAAEKIAALGSDRDVGAYFTPPPKHEQVFSNLLPITHLPERIYVAETDLSGAKAVFAILGESGSGHLREWTLRRSMLTSFHDLGQSPWTRICDPGTVDWFGTEEWENSTDLEQKGDFAWLLAECLRAKVDRLGVRYNKQRDCFYFQATGDRRERHFGYRSLAKMTSRVVFGPYKKVFRHSAFSGHFTRYGSTWFLKINPTYHYTLNGYTADPNYQTKLKGIKALEKNGSVLGQVIMWAELLGSKDNSLFVEPYPFLEFGSLLRFDLDAGINEQIWLSKDTDLAAIEAWDQKACLFD